MGGNFIQVDLPVDKHHFLYPLAPLTQGFLSPFISSSFLYEYTIYPLPLILWWIFDSRLSTRI